jgi:tight adherence protein C
LFAATALVLLVRRAGSRRRSQERLFAVRQAVFPAGPSREPGPLSRWLQLAGYRSPAAAAAFLLLLAVLALAGVAVAFGLWISGVMALAERGLDGIPGGLGDMFRPVLYIAPWFVLALVALTPVLVVRRARRLRVSQVERDLPVTLELLATLSESGLGFDAALARVQQAQPPERVLGSELRTFQTDVLSGRPRVECLRRLSRRLDVPAISILVSALVQAEQIGSGVADTLRRQADDLRNRRRERATEVAMQLPVKLLFPLVICFLPGIFVFTLGPTFYQFFQYADTIVRAREF